MDCIWISVSVNHDFIIANLSIPKKKKKKKKKEIGSTDNRTDISNSKILY